MATCAVRRIEQVFKPWVDSANLVNHATSYFESLPPKPSQ